MEDWKYQISLALPENTSDEALAAIYDVVEAEINSIRRTEIEDCARVAERFYSGYGRRTAVRIADAIRSKKTH
jgi:hypothetical protein